jgi:glucose/mannose transport system permease protein
VIAGRLLIYGVLLLFVLYFLLPLLVMVITSIKSMEEIRTGNLISLPRHPTIEPWIKAWSYATIGVTNEGIKGFFWNSIRMVIPAVMISTLIGALNGYVLAKWRFRGSDTFFAMLLLGCFIPFQVILLPMARTLGFLGIWPESFWGLVLVHIIYGLAFTTLFFRNYYVAVPDELVKAARIDGAGFFRIFCGSCCPSANPSSW